METLNEKLYKFNNNINDIVNLLFAPKGRIIEIFGPEASGKTTLALQVLANIQKKTGKRVAFVDVENALDVKYAKRMGLDMERVVLNQPNSGEEALDITEKLCQTNAISAVVIDSVAQLAPMATLNKEIDQSINIATTARLLSQTLPRLSNAASRSETILIFINQIRMNIGTMWGNDFNYIYHTHSSLLTNYKNDKSLPVNKIVNNKLTLKIWTYNTRKEIFELQDIGLDFAMFESKTSSQQSPEYIEPFFCSKFFI